MRILLLNPNSTQFVTDRIQKAAEKYQKIPGLEITARYLCQVATCHRNIDGMS